MALPSKKGYLKNTTATLKGFVDKGGRIIQPANLTQAEVDTWNGVEKKKKSAPKKKAEVVVEEVVEVEEVLQEVMEDGVVDAEEKGILKSFFSKK